MAWPGVEKKAAFSFPVSLPALLPPPTPALSLLGPLPCWSWEKEDEGQNHSCYAHAVISWLSTLCGRFLKQILSLTNTSECFLKMSFAVASLLPCLWPGRWISLVGGCGTPPTVPSEWVSSSNFLALGPSAPLGRTSGEICRQPAPALSSPHSMLNSYPILTSINSRSVQTPLNTAARGWITSSSRGRHQETLLSTAGDIDFEVPSHQDWRHKIMLKHFFTPFPSPPAQQLCIPSGRGSLGVEELFWAISFVESA